MSWTKEDLDALEEAIKDRAISGTLEVTFPSGKSIRFESTASMLKVRAEMIRYLNDLMLRQAGIKPSTHSLATFS